MASLPLGASSRQGLTVYKERDAFLGEVLVDVTQKVRNAKRIYLVDFAMQLEVGPPPFAVRLEFKGPSSIQSNDLNIPSQFVMAPTWDGAAGRLILKQYFGYPGFSFCESPGRDIPVTQLNIKVTDESGVTINFLKILLHFAVEYDTTPNAIQSSQYNAPNLAVASPSPTASTSPFAAWASTLMAPY